MPMKNTPAGRRHVGPYPRTEPNNPAIRKGAHVVLDPEQLLGTSHEEHLAFVPHLVLRAGAAMVVIQSGRGHETFPRWLAERSMIAVDTKRYAEALSIYAHELAQHERRRGKDIPVFAHVVNRAHVLLALGCDPIDVAATAAYVAWSRFVS